MCGELLQPLASGLDQPQCKCSLLAGKRLCQHKYPVFFQPGGKFIRLRTGAEENGIHTVVCGLNRQLRPNSSGSGALITRVSKGSRRTWHVGFPGVGAALCRLTGGKKCPQRFVVLLVACVRTPGIPVHLTF